MNNIIYILELLKKKEAGFSGNFFIPEAWNNIGFNKFAKDETRPGEICVNPYSYIAFCLETYILPRKAVSPAAANDCMEPDLTKSTIYSMLPRMFTAWEHYEKGNICGGTFLKAICHLPYLKKLNVDIVYLLPIFEYSDKYKKGEIGSPYAIKNVYKLDPNMHDPLLGEYSDEMMKAEFKAFVEVCHILGMKVMVDFVFRTVARDSYLIFEHPEWFYWIKKEYNGSFKTPSIGTDKKLVHLNERKLSKLYRSEEMPKYLQQFTFPPNELNIDKWLEVKGESEKRKTDISDFIEAEYGICTVPGFSNVLNDPQPPWTDVTFLKFYFDNHEKARKYIADNQPPYIVQDGVCLNIYPGSDVNTELWDYIAGVIPYYQEEYGIDGARIDMGHALPQELNKEIVSRAKAGNRNFILWSEIFDPNEAETAKRDGFHFISGFISMIYKEIDKPGFNKKLFEDTLLKSALPITAAMESHDTPRAAYVHKDKRRLELLLLLNSFIPNTVQFINNGFEAMEIQPMNLGLDNTEDGKFVLEENDPMYGKLALFDNYYIHWLNSERIWIQDLMLKAAEIRRDYIDLISRKELFAGGSNVLKNKKTTFISYFDNENGKYVFFLANRSMNSRAKVNLANVFPEGVKSRQKYIKILYQNNNLRDGQSEWNKSTLLQPGEIIIGCIE